MTTRKLGQLRVMEQSANDPSHIRCPYELVQYAENIPPFVRLSTYNEISKQVIRRKLARQRHCVIEKAIDSEYLDSLFPELLHLFEPQEVNYNGGVAGIKRWKISCYLEVMPGGVPTTNPNLSLLQLFTPVLDACNHMFQHWYRQQHACNKPSISKGIECQRVMTFITRYTPQPGEQSLLKVTTLLRHHIQSHFLYRLSISLSLTIRCVMFRFFVLDFGQICMGCLFSLKIKTKNFRWFQILLRGNWWE